MVTTVMFGSSVATSWATENLSMIKIEIEDLMRRS